MLLLMFMCNLDRYETFNVIIVSLVLVPYSTIHDILRVGPLELVGVEFVV